MKKSFTIFLGACSIFFLAAKVVATPLDGDIRIGEKANAKIVQRSHGELLARRTQAEHTFPGIYYTDTTPDNAQSQEMVAFVATIDFQGAQNVGTDIYRVSFLVRNSGEYQQIELNNPYGNMNIDEDATANLRAYNKTRSVASQTSGTIEGFPCYRNIDGMFNF